VVQLGSSGKVASLGNIADREALYQKMAPPIGKRGKGNQVEHSIGRNAQAADVLFLHPLCDQRLKLFRKNSQDIARGFISRFRVASFLARKRNAPMVSCGEIVGSLIDGAVRAQVDPA